MPPPKRDTQMSQADREEMELFENLDKEAKAEREQEEREEDEASWLDDSKNVFPVEPPILLKNNIWEQLSREAQWGNLSDKEKQATHRSAVEETWDAVTQARSPSGFKQRKRVKVKRDWNVGYDPMEKFKIPDDDPGASGSGATPWGNIQSLHDELQHRWRQRQQ